MNPNELNAFDESKVDEAELLTIHDERGKPATFHAFICAADEDFSHVMTLLETLEGKWGLRLCFGPRDLIAGDSHTVNATVVHLRCRRTIFVLSPAFLRSPMCEFLVKFARALTPGAKSKRMIPVMFEACNFDHFPDVLRDITPVNFCGENADKKEQWNWERIAKTLQLPLAWSKVEMPSVNEIPVPTEQPCSPTNGGNGLDVVRIFGAAFSLERSMETIDINPNAISSLSMMRPFGVDFNIPSKTVPIQSEGQVNELDTKSRPIDLDHNSSICLDEYTKSGKTAILDKVSSQSVESTAAIMDDTSDLNPRRSIGDESKYLPCLSPGKDNQIKGKERVSSSEPATLSGLPRSVSCPHLEPKKKKKGILKLLSLDLFKS